MFRIMPFDVALRGRLIKTLSQIRQIHKDERLHGARGWRYRTKGWDPCVRYRTQGSHPFMRLEDYSGLTKMLSWTGSS